VANLDETQALGWVEPACAECDAGIDEPNGMFAMPLVTAVIPDTDVVSVAVAPEAVATGQVPIVSPPATPLSEVTSPGAIPRSVQAAAAWSWRLLLIGAFAVAVVWILSHIATLIIPMVMALLVALLLLPVRNFLVDRVHMGRKAAVATAILGSIAVISVMVWFAFRQVYAVLPDLASQVIAGVGEIRNWLDGPPLNISTDQFDATWAGIQSQITGSANIGNTLSTAMGAVGTVQSVLTGLVVLVFCSIFFLADGRTIWTWMVNLLPVTVREKVHQAARRGAVTLSAYVRTQILVAAIDGTGIGLGMLFFVPNFALPIGVLVFIGSSIPILGAIITGSVAAIVVLVAHGWVQALIMLGIVLLVQQLESSILLPILMGHAVSLHPVAVALAVAGGSMVAGLGGALFAVPLVAVVNTVVQYLFGVDKFPELGTHDHVPLLRRPEFEQTMSVLHMPILRRNRKGHHDDEHPRDTDDGIFIGHDLDREDDDVVAKAGVVSEGQF